MTLFLNTFYVQKHKHFLHFIGKTNLRHLIFHPQLMHQSVVVTIF